MTSLMSPPAIPLDEVIRNDEFESRPARAADRAAERVALSELAREFSQAPRAVLQALSDASLRLTGAHSAGISLIEEDEGRTVFRWHAVSGSFAHYVWSTLPREFSPCGTVLDRAASQLMVAPERHFPYISDLSPQVCEVLLVPFALGEVNVGTIWVVSHDRLRRFDREDRRVVTRLAKVASIAYAGLTSLSTMDVVRLARLSKSRIAIPALPSRSIQRRVLLVDADPASGQTLSAQLRSLGHEVHWTRNVSGSPELSRRLVPDVVLLDGASDLGEALAAARSIRAAGAASLRIFMIGGYARNMAARDTAAFDRHFPHPLETEFIRALAE